MLSTFNSDETVSPISMDSPKRKHRELAETTTPPRTTRYQSPLVADELTQQEGCDSPRSKVAQRLEFLDIQKEASPSPRKKARLSSPTSTESGQHPNEALWHSTASGTLDGTMRVKKKLDSRQRSYSPSSKPNDSSSPDGPHRRIRSPPPPLAYARSMSQPEADEDGDSEPGADPLTWQISEITGMNLDLPAGDDGEGLNGIGFRPSPQAAQARAQRRRQQVNQWKMREDREARQKRFEKRQGCRLRDGSDEAMRERSVRFAETL